MRKYGLLLPLLLFLFSCAEKSNPASTEQPKKYPFRKIIFHTSECFGTCPVYHLEVDSDQTFRLFIERAYKKGAELLSQTEDSLTGYYKGTANDTTFNKLTKQLQTIGIDTINFGNSLCCDGSLITIIVYHDGKRRYMQSMFPPDRAWKLINALYEICETSKMERTKEKFEIENTEK